MQYIQPPSSKNAVKKATKAYQKDCASEEQMELLDQWRASHSYVLKIFSQWLKQKIDKSNLDILFVQRLKRKNTILDKLRRSDINDKPIIDNLTRMHDLAGCRLIFETVEDLYTFREIVNSQSSLKSVNHKLKNSPDKYDYIKNIKNSGYRGVHDIYENNPRKHKKSDLDNPWKGLLIEIQYRTKIQHAWATSVEISDLINNKRNKFEHKQDDYGEFFNVVSELLRRKYEPRGSGALAKVSTDELKSRFHQLDDKTQLSKSLLQLNAAKQSHSLTALRVHNVLNLTVIAEDDNGEEQLFLQHETFSNANLAIDKTRLYENDPKSKTAVYIHTANPKLLRQTFQNYYMVNELFSEYLNEIIQ